MNDINHRTQQEFKKKYPNAYNKADQDDFFSRGFTTFYGKKLDDYRKNGLEPFYGKKLRLEGFFVTPKVVYKQTEFIVKPEYQIADKELYDGLPEPQIVDGVWRDVVSGEASKQEYNTNIFAIPDDYYEEEGIELTEEELKDLDKPLFYETDKFIEYISEKKWNKLYNNDLFTLPDDYKGIEISDEEFNQNIFALPDQEPLLSDMMEELAKSWQQDQLLLSPATNDLLYQTFHEVIDDREEEIGEEISDDEFNTIDIFALPNRTTKTKVKTLLEQLEDERRKESMEQLEKDVTELEEDIEELIEQLGEDTHIPDKNENPLEYELVVSRTDESYRVYQPIVTSTYKPKVTDNLRPSDFNHYDDPINYIPENVRRELQHVGNLWDYDNKYDVYTFKEHKWKKGEKLVHGFIMANVDEMRYHNRKSTARGYGVNCGIPINENKTSEWITIGSYQYPRKYIEPYVKDQINEHGLVICTQIQGLTDASPLMIPYNGVTLVVSSKTKGDIKT